MLLLGCLIKLLQLYQCGRSVHSSYNLSFPSHSVVWAYQKYTLKTQIVKITRLFSDHQATDQFAQLSELIMWYWALRKCLLPIIHNITHLQDCIALESNPALSQTALSELVDIAAPEVELAVLFRYLKLRLGGVHKDQFVCKHQHSFSQNCIFRDSKCSSLGWVALTKRYESVVDWPLRFVFDSSLIIHGTLAPSSVTQCCFLWCMSTVGFPL